MQPQAQTSNKTVPKKKKREGAHLFQKGQVANPLGRPKGSRNKLGEVFVDALIADFEVHGAQTIVDVREDKPDVYLRVIAHVVPKELIVRETGLEDMSDEQLLDFVEHVRSALARTGGKKAASGNRPQITQAPNGKEGRAD